MKKISIGLLFAFLWLGITSPASAVVTLVDNNAIAGSSCNSGSSGAVTPTVTSGAALLIVGIEVDTATPGTVTGVWDSGGTAQAMTLLGTVITETGGGGGPATVALLGLLSPTSGTHTVNISFSGLTGGTNCYVQGVTFNGVTTPLASAAIGYATSSGATSVSGGLSTTGAASAPTGSIVYAFGSDQGNGFTGAVSSSGCTSATQLQQNQGLNTNAQSASCAGSGGAPTLIQAQVSSNQWAQAIIILSPGGGGGGGTGDAPLTLTGVGG